jgi:hypothetical protein
MQPTIALTGGVELARVGLGSFKAGGAELRGARGEHTPRGHGGDLQERG